MKLTASNMDTKPAYSVGYVTTPEPQDGAVKIGPTKPSKDETLPKPGGVVLRTVQAHDVRSLTGKKKLTGQGSSSNVICKHVYDRCVAGTCKHGS